jgi:hypothetical protein
VSNAPCSQRVDTTSASVFQKFVESLWANQDLAHRHYTDGDFAGLARQAGPERRSRRADRRGPVRRGHGGDGQAQHIRAEQHGFPGTPTVYDVRGREVVDISDPDWLDGSATRV